jgi:heme A synthase
MEFLFHAHSGLRYLILFVGVVAALYYAYARVADRPRGKGDRVLFAAYVGMLDLQLLLGLAMVIGGTFYPALMGHLTMMVLAVAAAHLFSVLSRRSEDSRRAHGLSLAGVVLSLVLIVGGITAIGRDIV